MSREFDGLVYADIMDDIFAKSKSFSSKEYYDEMVRICPEFKKKWWERIPSEKQVKEMVRDWYNDGVIDGKESVPKAEKELGIAIGGGYKFPNGMSDVEYHKERAIKYGCVDVFQKGNGREFCFNRRYSKKDGVSIITSSKLDKKKAYIQAWRNLQYGNREQIVGEYQKDWAELCDLNPELKSIKFDKNNLSSLGMAIAGVTYDFPAKDIELFVQNAERGKAGFHEDSRIRRELAEIGIKDFRFGWVPSSETVKMIGERLREKEAREKGALGQDAVIAARGEVGRENSGNNNKAGLTPEQIVALQMAKVKAAVVARGEVGRENNGNNNKAELTSEQIVALRRAKVKAAGK